MFFPKIYGKVVKTNSMQLLKYTLQIYASGASETIIIPLLISYYLMFHIIGYYGSGGGGGDYGGSGGSSYERNRPYGPPQAVDISSSANHGYYDSYENQNGLDWQQNNYGGIWNEKLNVIAISAFFT